MIVPRGSLSTNKDQEVKPDQDGAPGEMGNDFSIPQTSIRLPRSSPSLSRAAAALNRWQKNLCFKISWYEEYLCWSKWDEHPLRRAPWVIQGAPEQ